ncbi:MAG TPA: iron chelate uptake ABC transporter family permease subunit [Methanocella sp.]|nr:iron chelate uptake ABC transporter family permease subunit [Methanocella sp.]
MEGKALRWGIILLVLFVLTVAVAIVSMAMGPASVAPGEVVAILASKVPGLGGLVSPTWSRGSEDIVIAIRLPRVLLGLLVGASLGLAGVTTQGVFRNPMADPYILGISSGAALGASVVILAGFGAGLSSYGIVAGAFAGALVGAFLVFYIARAQRRAPVETLLLAGIAVSAFFSAITYFLMYVSGRKLNQIVFWVMGALWNSTWSDVALLAPFLLVGGVVVYAFARDLNVMVLGEEDAAHLGTDVPRTRTILLVASALLAAAAVAVSGIIGFVGLIIPHMMRLVLGPDHRVLIPASLLVGASFLTLADTFARTVMQPSEMPVGIVTAAIGAPFFVYLLARRKRGASA